MKDQGHRYHPNEWKNESEFREAFLNRTLPFITEQGSEILREKTVAIAGCGGVGGIAAVTFARMGVGRFHLADPGIFDSADINRQWGATTKTLGENKVSVYRDGILDIDPYAKVDLWEKGIQPDTVDSFLTGADLLVDCLDLAVSVELRIKMFEIAHQKGIYAFTAPILGFGAIVVCADPQGVSMVPLFQLLKTGSESEELPKFLYRVFMPEDLALITKWRKEKKTKVPSIAIAPLAAVSVVATESLAALIGEHIPGGRRPISFPRLFMLDILRSSYFVVNAEWLLKKEGEAHEA